MGCFDPCLLQEWPRVSLEGAQLCGCTRGPFLMVSQQHNQWGLHGGIRSTPCNASVLCCWHWVHVFVIDTQPPNPAGKPCLSSRSSLKEMLLLISEPESGWEGGVCLPTSSNTLLLGDANRTVLIWSPQRQTLLLLLLRSWWKCLPRLSREEIAQLCLWWELPVIYTQTETFRNMSCFLLFKGLNSFFHFFLLFIFSSSTPPCFFFFF